MLIILAQSLVFVSCEEAPRDRPTFNYSEQVSSGTDVEVEENALDLPFRPNDEIFFENGFCGCKNGQPITLGNCGSFCSSKNVENETLYLTVELSSEITGKEYLGDLKGWCTNELIDPNTNEPIVTNPSCQITAKDENGNVGALTMPELSSGQTNLEINISTLDPNKTYRIEIKEITSGATSKTIQVRKYEAPPEEPIGGPLWTVPVSQYTCLWRLYSTQGSSIFYEDIQRVHFYFTDETRPEPLPNNVADIYCHDIYMYGSTPINNPLLEETPGSYTLWSLWDPRFYPDPNIEGGEVLRVNEILRQKVEDMGYSMTTPPNLFYKFEWANGVSVTSGSGGGDSSSGGSDSSTDGSADLVELGWYMTPWIDQNTFKAYCPKQTHYYSSNQLFVAMRDIIGVDTEGLYIAKQENVNDHILINETLLKQIWFYIEANQHIEPNNDTVVGKQIQFYWPPDPDSPFVRKSHQNVFTVKSAQEVSSGDSGSVSTDQQNADGSSSSYPPHDKRLGCIPKL